MARAEPAGTVRPSASLRKYQYWFALAAIVLYNNWLLGLLVNRHAMLAGATTSELGMAGQPWAMAFRVLDILAGLLFLLGAGAVVRLADTRKLRAGLIFITAVLGLSTIVESLIPLQCSSALSRLCDQRERLGLSGWQDKFHTIESVLSYTIISFLPLVVLLAVRARAGAYRLRVWSYLLIVFIIVWTIESIIRYYHGGASFGYEQRLFIVLFSWWYFQVLRLTRRQT